MAIHFSGDIYNDGAAVLNESRSALFIIQSCENDAEAVTESEKRQPHRRASVKRASRICLWFTGDGVTAACSGGRG